MKDLDAVIDFRTAAFDLDNVYGRGKDDQPYLYEGDKFVLGVKILGGSPHGDQATPAVVTRRRDCNGGGRTARSLSGDVCSLRGPAAQVVNI